MKTASAWHTTGAQKEAVLFHYAWFLLGPYRCSYAVCETIHKIKEKKIQRVCSPRCAHPLQVVVWMSEYQHSLMHLPGKQWVVLTHAGTALGPVGTHRNKRRPFPWRNSFSDRKDYLVNKFFKMWKVLIRKRYKEFPEHRNGMTKSTCIQNEKASIWALKDLGSSQEVKGKRITIILPLIR